MSYTKKISSSLLLGAFLFQVMWVWISLWATNKETLLSKIDALDSQITSLKSTATKTLEDKVVTLGGKYDTMYQTLGYESKTVSYLVSLGKLATNYKQDLINEFTTLSQEISDKTLVELNALTAIKNDIRLNYSEITAGQKVTFDSKLQTIESNANSLSQSFWDKTNVLINKYTTSLSNYENDLRNAYNANNASMILLSDFGKKYDALLSVYTQFTTNYTTFKQTYLAYAWDLTLFSEQKQLYYVNLLKTELDKIKDTNLEANTTLQNYSGEIQRFVDLLLQNFANALKEKINDGYGVIYSDSDVNSLISRFQSAQNKYFDLDGNLKATTVLSSSGATEEINFLSEKIGDVNSKISTLLWTGSTSNTYDNIKIRLENEMIRYYNDNYKNYREDLKEKLKEKINYAVLDQKNTILAADWIDLRYSMLNDKISTSSDFNFINKEVNQFKKDIEKYSLLWNPVLDKKITNLSNNLDIFYVKKELVLAKYKKFSSKTYDAQITAVFKKLQQKYPDTYKDRLQTALNKLNSILERTNLSTKTRFILLVLKLNILNTLK